MKRSTSIAVGIATSLALGLATAAYAHQGEMGAGAHAKGGMHHDMDGGIGHGAMARGNGGHGARNQLMTPEERTATREQMRNAAPDERRKIAERMHAKMQARAQEQGVTPHEHRGPRSGNAGGSPGAAQNPGTTEHAH